MNATMRSVSTDEISAQKEAADTQFAAAVETQFLDIAANSDVLTDEDKLDKKRLAQKVYEVLRTKHVVDISPGKDDRRDRKKSSSKEELAAAMFPDIPSASLADTDLVKSKVRDKCLSAVWNVTQTGERGQVQKLLRGDSLILIRGPVFRDSLTVSDGIYVSTHEEVVMREFLAPRLERFRKMAESIEEDFEMAIERAPELAGPMRAAIADAVVSASARLPVPTLGAGESNGREALGK
jgi:hypothetical protein